jgi:hypothetical protein
LITWTIGAGGLLGSAIQRHVEHSFDATEIPWSNEQQAVESKQVAEGRTQHRAYYKRGRTH